MLSPILAATLALQPAPVPPAPDPAVISQENRALLRCAAAFALVAQGQTADDPEATRWPDLRERGLEFFVRAMAQVMDATGSDRAGIARLANAEAQALKASGEVPRIMPSCLLMLEASGL